MSSSCRLMRERYTEIGLAALRADPSTEAHIEHCDECRRLIDALDEVENGMAQLREQSTDTDSDSLGSVVGKDALSDSTSSRKDALSDSTSSQQEDPMWHVASEDGDTRQMSLAELERHWEGGLVDADSFVWRDGMAEWQALGDVRELEYLTELFPRDGGAAVTQHDASLETSSSAPEETSWTPLPTRSLSELVEQEQHKEVRSEDALGDSESNVAIDRLPVFEKPPQTDGWRVPEASRLRSGHGEQRSSGLRLVHLLAGGVMTSIVTAALVLAVVVYQQSDTVPSDSTPVLAPLPAPQPPASLAPASQEEQTEKPETTSTSDTPAAADARTETAGEDSNAVEKRAARVKAQSVTRPERTRHSSRASTRASKLEGRSGNRDRELDDVLSTRSVKDNLSREDITNGVKKNMGNVMDCLKAARVKGELKPGRYTLVLDWKIQPNGSVSNARLKGPAKVMGTSLPSCFAAKMRRWKFPPSKKGAPITNFPFGPFTIK